jgi:hypothetical protein
MYAFFSSSDRANDSGAAHRRQRRQAAGAAAGKARRLDHFKRVGHRVERGLRHKIFAKAIKHRPRIRLTIRQRARTLEQWPQ